MKNKLYYKMSTEANNPATSSFDHDSMRQHRRAGARRNHLEILPASHSINGLEANLQIKVPPQ
jgi:hypothetical protein